MGPFDPILGRFQSNLAMRPASEHSFSTTCGHSALRLGISAQFGHAACFETLFLSHLWPFGPAPGDFSSIWLCGLTSEHSFSTTVTIRPCAWGFQYNSAMRPALKHSFSVTWGHSALHLGDFSPIRLCGLHQNILSQSHVAMRPCFQEIPVQVGHAAFIRTFLLSHIWSFSPAFGRFQSNLAMRPASEQSFSVT